MVFEMMDPFKSKTTYRTDYNGVRGSPNGKICKITNGTIFTNGNQNNLERFSAAIGRLVTMVPLVDHVVEFLSY